MKAKGLLIITDKAIYCAGNRYPFDKIIAVAKKGKIKKSISVEMEYDVEAGSGDLSGGRYSYEIEIKTKDLDKVFEALEQARLSAHGVEIA